MQSGADVFSRILERYNSDLTDAEKRIADYILNHPHETVIFSVTMLAEKAATSEATVVRFARTLGFKGFLELKSNLLKRASNDLAQPDRAERADSQTRNVQELVTELEVENLQRTLRDNGEKEFLEFSDLLSRAAVIYTLGIGVSSLLSRLAAYQLTMVGRRAIAMAESFASYDKQLALASPDHDVLWVFSFPPYTPTILSVVEQARSQGMRVVAITDRRVSPISSMSNAVLYAANSNIIALNSVTSSTTLITVLLARLAKEERRTDYARDVADALDKAMMPTEKAGE